ncbi:hypothetical protein GGI15_002271 [Coemansia interrupta]|uniref:Uncharacterized protein n=1 Tax=Coemansia interrupta TaxID=1126814 RepID=A0A9W8HEL8_9FUNG|nr:hypothetical protein GGI15_002271 [Coemansia interrupta]
MQSPKLPLSPAQPQSQQPQPAAPHKPHPSPQTILDPSMQRRATRALRQMYHREHHFLHTLTPQELEQLTQQDAASLSEQHHYGELAFLLLGLKPCALLDYAERGPLLEKYLSCVVRPSLEELNHVGQQGGGAFELRCRRIEQSLESPEGGSWQGAYVLWDERREESRRWAGRLLEGGRIPEDDLARALDYPGSLPKTAEELRSVVPVSYLGRMKSESGEWMSDRWECLTAFIVLQHELPQMALHRMRYQAVRVFDIEMQVAMDTSSMDQMYSGSEEAAPWGGEGQWH